MTPMTDLLALAGRVEGASGPDRELDRDIALAVGGRPDYSADWRGWGFDEAGNAIEAPVYAAYTGSLDAAMTLVPHDCVWGLSKQEIQLGGPYHFQASVMPLHGPWADAIKGNTPALALTSACLRAVSISQEPHK